MLNELQAQIYLHLNTLGYPVYDAVPEESTYPYIVIGDDIANNWGTKSFPAWNVLVTIHVWSSYDGWQEVKAIMEAIEEKLCINEFVLPNHTIAVLLPESMQVLRDPSGLRHGILRLRIKII